MGIESEQLVFDYLSRVGDLAHSTTMTAAERARLVGELRGEIDRLRAAQQGSESKAGVKKILARLGRPEELVAAAAGGATVPSPRAAAEDAAPPGRWSRKDRTERTGRSDRAGPGPEGFAPPPPGAASPPHLAGMDELGPTESNPDWWRTDTGLFGAQGGDRPGSDLVPGFVGGIELPELLKPPPGADDEEKTRPTVPQPAVEQETAEDGEADGTGARSGLMRRVLKRRGPGPGGPRVGGVVELLAAAALVASAVTGSLYVLGAGWLAAYWSPRLSRNEAKWAAMGVPALVATGWVVWVWGRGERHWGDRIAAEDGALREVLTESYPVALRTAAVAAALFLVWRARRPRG